MRIDPELAPFLPAAAEAPPSRAYPIETLREIFRQYAAATPKLDVPLTVTDRAIDGPAGPLRLRLYHPPASGGLPILLFFHGGGWVIGDLDTQDNIARALADAAQAIVISVDYRLAPENPFPAAVEDCWAALQWAGAHAAELGGDAARLAVCGDSAGGVLASVMALRARDECGVELRAQVNFYGSCNYPSARTESSRLYAQGPILTADDVDYFWSQYLADPDEDQHHPYASPFRAASHKGLAPAFIGTAEFDPSRDDAEAYAAKLRAAGVPVEQRRYPGMVHGFLSWIGMISQAQRGIDDAAAFLRAQFA